MTTPDTRPVDVYRLEVMVTDHERMGQEDIKTQLENMRYVLASVMSIDKRTVDWHDKHPLNNTATHEEEFARIFAHKDAA